jgi:hypothetical protein
LNKHLDTIQILDLAKHIDIEEIRKNLEAFRRIAAGDADGGPIASLDEAERFRWLTALRSATIQASRPHPGVCNDLDKTIRNLFAEMVGQTGRLTDFPVHQFDGLDFSDRESIRNSSPQDGSLPVIRIDILKIFAASLRRK